MGVWAILRKLRIMSPAPTRQHGEGQRHFSDDEKG